MNACADLSCVEHDRQPAGDDAIRRLCAGERAILKGIAAGFSRAQLARDFSIDRDEMAKAIDELFEKIGAKVTADAVRMAIVAGL